MVLKSRKTAKLASKVFRKQVKRLRRTAPRPSATLIGVAAYTAAGLCWAILATLTQYDTAVAHSDTVHIATEAIRLADADMAAALHVAKTPEYQQPPLRSVPVALAIEIVPGHQSVHWAGVAHRIWTRLASVLSVAVIGWYTARRSDERVALGVMAALLGARILYNPAEFDSGLTAPAIPFAFLALVAAWRATEVEGNRRIWWALGTAAATATCGLIDVEPALVTTAIATCVFLLSDPPAVREWLLTGFAGVAFLLPFMGQASNRLSGRIRIWFYWARVEGVRLDSFEKFLPIPEAVTIATLAAAIFWMHKTDQTVPNPVFSAVAGVGIVGVLLTPVLTEFTELSFVFLIPFATAEAVALLGARGW